MSKLCVGKFCVWRRGGGRREEEERRRDADGSAQPKRITPHNDVGKKQIWTFGLWYAFGQV